MLSIGDGTSTASYLIRFIEDKVWTELYFVNQLTTLLILIECVIDSSEQIRYSRFFFPRSIGYTLSLS